MNLEKNDIKDLEHKFRIRLMNSVTGFKSVNLIATRHSSGADNVAIFSSVTHYGSDPAVIGVTFRPPTPRQHTYRNIKEHGVYTINQVNRDIFAKAHQTSGAYNEADSEFAAVGLSPLNRASFPGAPFVRESHIRIGMEYLEEHPIAVNGTILLIGQVVALEIDDAMVESNGVIDHDKARTVTVSGLESYYGASLLERLPQVRV